MGENHKKFQSSLVVSRRHGLNSYPRPGWRDQNMEPPPRASDPERRRKGVGRAEGVRHGRTEQYLPTRGSLVGAGIGRNRGLQGEGTREAGGRAGGRQGGAQDFDHGYSKTHNGNFFNSLNPGTWHV